VLLNRLVRLNKNYGEIMKSIIVAVFIAVISVSFASAQANDVWSALAEKSGAFSPHRNNCDSGESFVAIAGGNSGYCIEQSERTADGWEGAKETCGALGKRLPEVAEYVYACKRAASLSLSNMTNNGEWVSNSAQIEQYISGGTSFVAVPTAGAGSCNTLSYGAVGTNTGYVDTLTFRCVS